MTASERLSGVDGRRGRKRPGFGVLAAVVLLHWALLGGWWSSPAAALPRALQVRTVVAVRNPVASAAPESPPAAAVLEAPRLEPSRRARAVVNGGAALAPRRIGQSGTAPDPLHTAAEAVAGPRAGGVSRPRPRRAAAGPSGDHPKSARTVAVDSVPPLALAPGPSTAAALTDAGSAGPGPAVSVVGSSGPGPAIPVAGSSGPGPAVPVAGLNPAAADVAGPNPASAAPEDAEPPPVYRTRLPLSATLHFDVRRGAASGDAELRWQRTAEGYSIRAEVRVAGVPVLTQSSRGGVDVAGLAPVRFVDQRAARASAAINFRRDSGRISFSRKAADAALVSGAQDRLSWLVQLAAIMAADPALRQDGAEVRMSVAGAGGEVSVWRFRCEGAESTGLGLLPGPGDAPTPAWHCVRAAAGPYDTRAEAWLGRVGNDVLPLRAAWRSGPTDEGFDLRLRRADALSE